MSISQTGLVQWTPASNQTGSFTVIVNVSDGRGGLALQQYRVTVLAQGIDLAVAAVNTSAVTTDAQTLVVGGSVRVEIQNRGGSLFSGQFAVLVFEDRNNNGTYDSGIDNAVRHRDVLRKHRQQCVSSAGRAGLGCGPVPR